MVIPADFPKALTLGLLVTLILFIALLLINEPLQTSAAPKGIISFQMAGTVDQASEILASWNGQGLSSARTSLWLDFAFAGAYVITLLLLTKHLSRDRPGVRERTVSRWVKGLFIGAGVSDIAENVFLLNNLDAPSDSMSLAAVLCALAKFTGLILGLAGLVILRAARRHPLSHG
ncbi:hypothetical protein [Marinobacter confluentis]|uniref:Uncharacterized protein n=1 Tax=Marinobacter confluentis TaxID=1697557 RepID=A0A4Z1BUR8_9GAMM|nr:hypothetical protein [Marinobacter confluentis]TGN38296.1 hypothetical protein E5Q11_15815 [Marinobacter confluentis]